jgi:hypothetical protein
MQDEAKCVPGTAAVFLSVFAISKLAGGFCQSFVEFLWGSWAYREP